MFAVCLADLSSSTFFFFASPSIYFTFSIFSFEILNSQNVLVFTMLIYILSLFLSYHLIR
jgi:hypothetical protein